MSIRVQAAAVRLVLGLPHQLDVNPAPAASYLQFGGRLKPCRQRGGRASSSRSGWSDVGQITTPRHASAQGMLTWKVVPTPTVLSPRCAHCGPRRYPCRSSAPVRAGPRRTIAPPKTVEDMRQVLGRDTWAGVPNDDLSMALALACAKRHATALGRELKAFPSRLPMTWSRRSRSALTDLTSASMSQSRAMFSSCADIPKLSRASSNTARKSTGVRWTAKFPDLHVRHVQQIANQTIISRAER